MDESTRSPRVRRGFRRLAIFSFVVLLPLATHSVWDYLEARRLSSIVEAIRSRGERTAFAAIGDDEPVTAEQKEASRYYGAAGILAKDAPGERLQRAEALLAELVGLHPGPSALVAGDPRLEELRRLEASYTPALDLIDRASLLDARGLDYSHRTPFGFPEWSLANINGVRIARLALAGQSDAACRALLSTLRLHRVFADPYYVTVPIPVTNNLRQILTLAPPDERMLSTLQQEFSRWDADSEIERRLIDNRARLIERFWPAASGPSLTLPRIRESRDFGSSWLVRPWVTNRITRVISQYEEALAAARLPWPARLDAAADLQRRYPASPRQTAWLSANLAAAEIGRLAPAVAAELSLKRVSIVVLAVERYRRATANRPPAALDDLVPQYLERVPQDPFSGQTLRYSTTGARYAVYSVGVNRADDGGDWTDIGPEHPRRRYAPLSQKDVGLDLPLR
jgi:hypothetical protein